MQIKKSEILLSIMAWLLLVFTIYAWATELRFKNSEFLTVITPSFIGAIIMLFYKRMSIKSFITSIVKRKNAIDVFFYIGIIGNVIIVSIFAVILLFYGLIGPLIFSFIDGIRHIFT